MISGKRKTIGVFLCKAYSFFDNAIFGGGADMLSMDTELAKLLRDGRITKEQASLLAIHPETVERQARFMRE